jgi:hypothetical protein
MAGTVAPKVHLAGQLAFVAATTNNQAVSVDFASWVRGTSNNGVILGNVSGTSPWNESVYVAREEIDGSVRVFVRLGSGVAGAALPAGALTQAYDSWLNGLGPKPIPKRCAGTQFLHYYYGEPILPGKCDGYAEFQLVPSFSWRNKTRPTTWSMLLGTAVRANEYMYIEPPQSRSATIDMYVCARVDYALRDSCVDPQPVLSETYVHLWEQPYE